MNPGFLFVLVNSIFNITIFFTMKGDNNMGKYRLTVSGKEICDAYIAECKAKRKEIMDAGKDTCNETNLPTIPDILDDIEFQGIDDDNEYYNCWGVTDNYDSDNPLSLTYGKDFVLAKPKLKIEKICPENRDTMSFAGCACISCLDSHNGQRKDAEYVMKISDHATQLCFNCAIELSEALNEITATSFVWCER